MRIDPMFLEKEDLQRICDKSIKATGKKWLWRKIAERHGLTFEQIEAELDEKIARNEAYIKEMEERFGRHRQKSSENGTTDESGLGAAPYGRDSQGEPITAEHFAEPERTEIRPGETENGPASSEGSQ